MNRTRPKQIVIRVSEEELAQIKEKEYALRFKGKTAERKEYTGRILAVGISYNSKTKEHECKIEKLSI